MVDERPFYVHPDDPPSKQAILAAALDLFASRGVAGTTLRNIAEKSGFTNPALFRFFDGKDDLALFLFRRCYERLSRELSSALAPGSAFADNLRHVINHFASFVDRHPAAFLYVQDNLRHFWPRVPEQERQMSVISLTRRLIGQGIAEGVVAGDVPVDLLVATIAGLLAQVARLRYFGEIAELASVTDELYRVACRAVLCDGARQAPTTVQAAPRTA
ncbi:TetR/AcrR family transcriptional regulator [Myceligenerans indicum]|uniref:TetR/AcrR family transcriptional regulator n=1 Tax=Myceligenerans indicum TaxID=2593663 RepID=A0ABS1LQE3_9MICO|nr:TetR/AcrR family transcriptional regulator [Myceligenerans indicum]MBL0888496.1 TetR/AcrR family transcriptional regulator [Myceligenerans indicum]